MSPLPKIGDQSVPLLFLDDAHLSRSPAVERRFHPAATHSQPVLVADRPWERGRVYLYGSVLEDRDTGLLRLWYGTPKPSAVALAVSEDGIQWRKPILGEAGDNLVYPSLHSPSLWEGGVGAERFRLLGTGRGGACAAWSADGVQWRDHPGNPVFESDDTLTLARHPLTGEFLAFHKRQEEVRGFLRRTVWVSGSFDFRHWSPPVPALRPAEHEDAWAAPGQRTDLYSLAAFPHATGLAGWPLWFRVEQTHAAPAPNQAADDGPIDVGFATSSCGRRWAPLPDAPAMIPRGAPGAFDHGAILGTANTLIHREGETWLYYTALSTSHGAPMPPKQVAIGRAAWRLHGFASLTCVGEAGRIVTAPLQLPSEGLLLNADARGGWLRYGLCLEDGTAIPGFTCESCEPLLARDATAWQMRWNGGERLPTGAPVRLEFELADAALFSVYGA